MKVHELRALLDLLPARFDDTEVMVGGGHGLTHVGRVHFDPQRLQRRWFGCLDDAPSDRLERKLTIEGSRTLWYEPSTPWSLTGRWPKGARNVGIPDQGQVDVI